MKSVLERKYAKDVKALVETNGFVSYSQTTRELRERIGKFVDDVVVRGLMIDMKTENVIDFMPIKRGRPSKSKILLKMSMKQMCEKHGVARLSAKQMKQLETDGWKKIKADVFPFQISFEKAV